MLKSDAVLALDTSNYTTSLSVMTLSGELVCNLKAPLKVKAGECGLRQSDAVFAHTVNIPTLFEEARPFLSNHNIRAVGVSEKPRNVSGSYMPCFLSGVASATALSSALGVPLYKFSHQCGHIMAAIYSSGRLELLEREFAAFHISGGTTELVRVTARENDFLTDLVGGSADLNAGQVIDRVGVHLGLPFPAGAHIERLALENKEKIPKRKVSLKGCYVNLSGLENMAKKLYEEKKSASLCAAFVLDYISRSVAAMIDAYYESFGVAPVLCAGGVMSNSIIKRELSERYDVTFAEPALSTDNAVGIAALTRRAFESENGV